MLYLISLGLYDESDISLKALEAAKKCEKLYAEFYTTKMDTDVGSLGKLIGKPVTELSRKGLEEDSHKILNEAKKKDVGIFVGGDALTATTHVSLLLDAKKQGIKTKIIHGSSVYTAVAEAGLQLYKFGRATTLAFKTKGFSQKSCYDAIKQNKKAGLHTLVLLDIKSEKNRYMDITEGLNLLLEIEKKKKQNLIKPGVKVIAACQLGGSNQIIKYDSIKNLIKDKELKNRTPAVIVFPGTLHFMEKEFLELK